MVSLGGKVHPVARIRSIKPEFFSSLTIARLPLGARLLFIALWTEADDAGRLLDSPKRIAGTAYPHDEAIGAPEVAGWLEALSAEGLLTRYEADGKRLIQITGWHHQKISHPTESRLPPPPETFRKSSGETPEPLRKNSVADLGSRILDLGSGSRITITHASEPQAGKQEPEPQNPPTDLPQQSPARPMWATRAEPLSMHGPIPDTIGKVWAFQWRDDDIAGHLKRAAPDLDETERWDQTEDCLNYRCMLSDREFRQWLWPQGCVPRLIAWLERANRTHLDAQTARARAAKAGVYVADTKRLG